MSTVASLHMSPISCCDRRYTRCDEAYSLQSPRRSKGYAFFAAFCSVHPATTASRRPDDGKR